MTDTPAPSGAPAPAAGADAPKIDMGALYGTLSPENKDFATRRGYIKTDGSFGDPNLWLDGHRNAEQIMGGEKLPVPNAADEKALAEWPGWDKLGVPKDAKGYAFKRPEKMPNGLDGKPIAYDEAAENAFRDMAVKLKLTPRQFDAIMTDEVGRRMAAIEGATTTLNAEKARIETSLRKDFGAGYDAQKASAGLALNFIAKEAKIDAGKLADLASHEFGSEETARMFITIAAMLGEDKLQGGKDGGFATGPAAARAELEQMDRDPVFQKAYTNKDHPDHKKAIDRRLNLLRTANG